MADGKAEIGLIGLGTMGSALALNIAEKGFDIAVFNRTVEVTHAFAEEAGELAPRVTPCETLEAFVASIAEPRSIILMVPAGAPIDQQRAALRPLLGPDDLIIDAGNANFHDTNRRIRENDCPYLGIGVSGGEEGARHGPAIMGGGKREYWDRVAPILTAIAARFEGEPCAAWMGEEGAGHFVKAVHNGIEYADMQMIAEIYGILRDGMGLEAEAIGDIFARWDEGPLGSYLIEISGKVAHAKDAATGQPLLSVIEDAAGQKGTGRWTVIEAQHLGAPIPAIDAAVMARNVSANREMRSEGERLFGRGPTSMQEPPTLEVLERALIAGKIMCYAQGFSMISRASDEFGWSLPLPEIARVWRAGCIIRSKMLNEMAAALAEEADRLLIFAPGFARRVKETEGSLREVVIAAQRSGIAVPALGSGLAWFDLIRTARGTADMIQGQRDYFGLHGFVRLDTGEAHQHGPWGA